MSAPVLPTTAPFSAAQRAWLNGFFAGMVGTSLASADPTPQPSAPANVAVAEPEEMPWHDAALPLHERLALADGKPAARQLMAAMAQLDCGSCGYLCQTYAEAIADGREKNLALCSPGGKDTSKKLKEMVASKLIPVSEVRVIAKSNSPATGSTVAPPAYGRNNPFPARLLQNVKLNKSGSDKDTRLIVLDLKHSGLTYNVGDALGVYPENCADLVDAVLSALHASGAEDVQGRDGEHVSLRDALMHHYSITRPVGEDLLRLLEKHCKNPDEAAQLSAILVDDSTIEAAIDGHEILDLLLQFPSARPPVGDFVATLAPLQPRLYSISSSLKAHPNEVHLTVGVVKYKAKTGRASKGVASCYLSDRVRPGQKVRVFIHASQKFHVPVNSDAPLIMVGPGTGIAPFRAFLEERKATGSTGKNWVFFGDQRQSTDFLYEEELLEYQKTGLLTRLDLAFSRDQAAKVYVQHRMIEQGAEMWSWLEAGGSFCVCGDARRMAADVDLALRQIIATHGQMSADAATAYVNEMVQSKRYLKDVY
jgi:sulfite reductase (NADPH) flavoprotein alpha-component